MTSTPGPWTAKARATGGYNIVAVDDVLEDVVVGTAVLNDHSLETAHANAQILAAGPMMLAALHGARAELASILREMRCTDEDISSHRVVGEIDAAIVLAGSEPT